MPVARPLFFVDPADPALRSEDDAFLLGGDILVECEMTPDRSREVALPSGIWRPFDFGDGHDRDLPRLYLRGGAIVPTGPIMQYVDEKPLDTITLLVALDENGNASGDLYEDAGEGYAYRDGDFLLSRYEARRIGDEVHVTVRTIAGDRDRPARNIAVRLMLDGREVQGAGIEGEPIVIR
jgi:alpha-glucosidase